MKKLYLLPVLGLLLTACDNNDAETLPTLSDRTYEGLKELDLSYDGAPMVGKSATLSGDVLTFDSKVDLGSYSEALKVFPPIPGPGVLPGSPSLSIHLSFAPNKDKYSVAGSGETDFTTYSYLGSLTENMVNFQFYNVKLKDTRFAGRVWKPTPADSQTGASPFHIVWQTSQPGLLENFDGSIEDALKLIANLPLIPAYGNTAYMSASQLITSGVTSFSFNPDGNLVVTYLQKANGAAQFAQAPLCMIQYLPQVENSLKLYVNPTDLVSVILMNNTNKPDIPSNPFGKSASRADADISEGNLLELLSPEELELILAKAAPMLSQGIPMQYSLNSKSLEIYLPTEILLPLVKDVIAPLLAKPEVQEMIIARVENVASFKPYLPLVKGMLLALPLILETTTKAEIGFSLTTL